MNSLNSLYRWIKKKIQHNFEIMEVLIVFVYQTISASREYI